MAHRPLPASSDPPPSSSRLRYIMAVSSCLSLGRSEKAEKATGDDADRAPRTLEMISSSSSLGSLALQFGFGVNALRQSSCSNRLLPVRSARGSMAAVRRRLIQEVKARRTPDPRRGEGRLRNRTLHARTGRGKTMLRGADARRSDGVHDAPAENGDGDGAANEAVSVSRTCCHGAYEQLDLLGMLKDLQDSFEEAVADFDKLEGNKLEATAAELMNKLVALLHVLLCSMFRHGRPPHAYSKDPEEAKEKANGGFTDADVKPAVEGLMQVLDKVQALLLLGGTDQTGEQKPGSTYLADLLASDIRVLFYLTALLREASCKPLESPFLRVTRSTAYFDTLSACINLALKRFQRESKGPPPRDLCAKKGGPTDSPVSQHMDDFDLGLIFEHLIVCLRHTLVQAMYVAPEVSTKLLPWAWISQERLLMHREVMTWLPQIVKRYKEVSAIRTETLRYFACAASYECAPFARPEDAAFEIEDEKAAAGAPGAAVADDPTLGRMQVDADAAAAAAVADAAEAAAAEAAVATAAGGVPTVGESEASEQGIRGLGRTRRAAQRTLGSVGREHTVMVDAMEVDGNGDGHRAPHECIDAFFVELTKDSVVAVKEAQKRVAADWRSGFHSRGIQAEPKRRKKQIRCFRTAARWKAAGKKKPIEKKSSVAVAKKVAIIKVWGKLAHDKLKQIENRESAFETSACENTVGSSHPQFMQLSKVKVDQHGRPFGGLVSLRQSELRNFLAEELERCSDEGKPSMLLYRSNDMYALCLSMLCVANFAAYERPGTTPGAGGHGTRKLGKHLPVEEMPEAFPDPPPVPPASGAFAQGLLRGVIRVVKAIPTFEDVDVANTMTLHALRFICALT
ncbi:Hypothetical protein (Fragment) [Durusdinium trenchii]|uniref:Uncharacterized protein n=1 Tax=Durusdinium trenchii TaxID=1381693 RepID=A0ABP0IE09_9DINO